MKMMIMMINEFLFATVMLSAMNMTSFDDRDDE